MQVTGEMYPTRYRAQCMSLSTGSNWIWNFLIAFFTPFITGAIDFRYGYVFAACCLAASFTVYFFLLETQGKTLEEIDAMYIAGVKPWKSAKYIAQDDQERFKPGSLGSPQSSKEGGIAGREEAEYAGA